MVKYFSFHNSSFGMFSCKWQGHRVTHPLVCLGYGNQSHLLVVDITCTTEKMHPLLYIGCEKLLSSKSGRCTQITQGILEHMVGYNGMKQKANEVYQIFIHD